MTRKLDLPALLLFTALLFGVIVRFYPALQNGFPLNDGGMFYVMSHDLRENGFIPPQVTTYNHADIPFAYPPLGFYFAASLSKLTPDSDLWIFLYIPALVNSLSIYAFYLLAKETLSSLKAPAAARSIGFGRMTASLATLLFALSPRAFVWQVMGGGITRSFGMLSLLLMLWQAMRLFSASHQTQADNANPKVNPHLSEKTNPFGATHPLVLTIIFGAGAVMSHPQTALHAAIGGALIFLFYGRNKRGLMSALMIGAGVAMLSAPWWGMVLTRYGLTPLLSAGQSTPRDIGTYLSLVRFEIGDILFIPTFVLQLIGIYVMLTRRDFFLITLAVIPQLIDPRGGGTIAFLGLSMLAGLGLLKLSAWIQRGTTEQAEVEMKRSSQIVVFVIAFYSVLLSSIYDFQLVNTSLKTSDLEMISWVQKNVGSDKTFLLATGREFSMSDPMQEWFPALTGEFSATTLQGYEWTLGDQFFPRLNELAAFQHCADVQCVSEWSVKNKSDYDYLIVAVPTEGDESGLAPSLRSLGISARTSAAHMLVHETKNYLIFELSK
jgi:hypothetical protein